MITVWYIASLPFWALAGYALCTAMGTARKISKADAHTAARLKETLVWQLIGAGIVAYVAAKIAT